jgi:hypothetical protein
MPLVCKASSPLQVLMMLYTSSLPITQIQIRTRGVIFGSRWRYPQLQLTIRGTVTQPICTFPGIMESRKFVTVFTQSANKPYSRLTQCNPLYPQQYYSHIHTQVTSRISLLQCVLHVHLSYLLYWPASYEQLQLQLADFTLMQLTTSHCHFPSHRPNITVQFANTWMCVLLLQWRTNIHPPVFTVVMARHFDAVPLHDSKFISPILYPLLRSTNTYIQLRRSFWRQLTSSSTINHLTPNGHFSGRTAPLTYRCCIFLFIQGIYVLNIFNMLLTLHFFLFKMSFISWCYLFWFLYYSHFIYRVC